MKIPLRYINGLLLVNCFLISQRYHLGLVPIMFIVDTGSNATFIGHNDAQRLQIPEESLKFMEHFNMGSGKYALFKGKPVSLLLKTEERKTINIEFDEIPVSLSTKKGMQKEEEIIGIPSILGTDFLMENNLGLHFFPKKNEAWLEK